MKKIKKIMSLMLVAVMATTLCACSFQLPWDKGDSDGTTGDGTGDDFFGDDFSTEVESVTSGLTYNVGDVINATDVVSYDLSKVLTACVFMIDGNMSETITCSEAGTFTAQVLVQYEDFTEWTGTFEYTVEGQSIQIPQSVYEKLASTDYVKQLYNISDTFRVSLLSYGSAPSKTTDTGDNLNEYIIGSTDGNFTVRATASADTISKYYDTTLADAVTLAYYLHEVLGENWGSSDTISKLVKILYGEQAVSAAQSMLSTVEGGNGYAALALLSKDPGQYGTTSILYDLSNSVVSQTQTDTGEFLYSTNNDSYPVRKITRTFDGSQILGTTEGGVFENLYVANITEQNVVSMSSQVHGTNAPVWSFKLKGYDGSITELINDDAKLAEVALSISVPEYTDTTFDNIANMATWVRSLFVGEQAIFEATYMTPSSTDYCATHLDQVLIGDYSVVQIDNNANENLDDVTPEEQGGDSAETPEDGVQVVHKQSYQQKHPGLFEWPESDIIYRRWIYTVGEDDNYQGTIYLSDGTILQGTSGLNVWTGEYTPTTDFTTKTHTMRTSSNQYNLTNEKDTTYVINTGRSNSSTTSITKGSREYILSNVSDGWVTNAKSSPVYQGWQNAASFEAIEGATYSNNGFMVTPYTAKIVTGAGSNDYPYFVRLVYGNDNFVVYGTSNDVDLNEMLYIADNIIKAQEQEEQ